MVIDSIFIKWLYHIIVKSSTVVSNNHDFTILYNCLMPLYSVDMGSTLYDLISYNINTIQGTTVVDRCVFSSSLNVYYVFSVSIIRDYFVFCNRNAKITCKVVSSQEGGRGGGVFNSSRNACLVSIHFLPPLSEITLPFVASNVKQPWT